MNLAKLLKINNHCRNSFKIFNDICPTSIRLSIIWRIKAVSDNEVGKFEILYTIAWKQNEKNTAKKIRLKATHKIYQIFSITLKSHFGDIYEDWYNKVV